MINLLGIPRQVEDNVEYYETGVKPQRLRHTTYADTLAPLILISGLFPALNSDHKHYVAHPISS